MEKIHFHYPTDEEQKIVNKFNHRQVKLASYLGRFFDIINLRISYVTQGNFTICILKLRDCRYIGVAKRNPGADEDNVQRAQDISLYRAMSNPIYLNIFDE